ncbi:MAG: hypothetical protein JWM33_1158 [Caulobacteraceae bacterium]|nr:hypothetical protein [Caulobacteraceae bacterium]
MPAFAVRLLLILTLAAPLAAHAADGPSPAQLARLVAEGDDLLKAAHAEALFDNETASRVDGAIVLRHKASGFRCLFNPGKKQNKVTVYASLDEGEDVGCSTQTITDTRTLLIYRVGASKTSEALLASSAAEIKAQYPSATLLPPGDGPAAGGPAGIPTPAAASYLSNDGGDRIVVGKVGDWAVEYRFTGPKTVAFMGEILDASWLIAVAERQKFLQAAPARAPRSPLPPLTKKQADDFADELIGKASARGVFEKVGKSAEIALRHKQSGFVCTLSPGPDAAVAVLPNPVRGNDVSCTSRGDGAVTSWFVTRLPVKTAEEALAVYVADIRRAHPDAVPAAGTFGNMSASRPGAPSLPEHLTQRVIYELNGQKAFSRVSVAVIDGWTLEQRLTAPASTDDQGELKTDLAGEIAMIGAILQMSSR